ncbi:hypothetical protein VNO80_19148 [Phaseolus coccineus]|uniref:Uncharacterized protein n=1 Tax=Phaseolus coccineus TaxID=3886 RepID=A0AAN9MFW9_PHACN
MLVYGLRHEDHGLVGCCGVLCMVTTFLNPGDQFSFFNAWALAIDLWVVVVCFVTTFLNLGDQFSFFNAWTLAIDLLVVVVCFIWVMCWTGLALVHDIQSANSFLFLHPSDVGWIGLVFYCYMIGLCVGVALVECMMFNLRIVPWVGVALVECMMFNLRIVLWVGVALVECMMFNLRIEILKQNKALSHALDHQATVIGKLEKAVSRLEEVLTEKEKRQEGDGRNLSNENHDDDECAMSIEPIAVDYSNVKFGNDEEKCFNEMEVLIVEPQLKYRPLSLPSRSSLLHISIMEHHDDLDPDDISLLEKGSTSIPTDDTITDIVDSYVPAYSLLGPHHYGHVDRLFAINNQANLERHWILADAAGIIHHVEYNEDLLHPRLKRGWMELRNFYGLLGEHHILIGYVGAASFQLTVFRSDAGQVAMSDFLCDIASTEALFQGQFAHYRLTLNAEIYNDDYLWRHHQPPPALSTLDLYGMSFVGQMNLTKGTPLSLRSKQMSEIHTSEFCFVTNMY